MDFNKARTFVEVVDSGSVTLAASRLLRTQQAISLQLQHLELDLDLNLFDRQGPKITLTADGEKLYQQFKPSLLAMENAVLALRSGKQQASGVIRIGAWMEQAVNYLPEMMRIFKQDFQLVDFELHIAEDIEIEEMLKKNKLDFGFQLYCQDKQLFKCQSVYRQPLLGVISRNFLKKHSAPNTIADTFNLPLVDYVGEYSGYNLWIKKNARELLPQARKKIRTVTISNNLVLKQLVLQGLGFGFLLQESIQRELELGELVPLSPQLVSDNIHVDIDMVYKRKDALGYVHQAFLQMLLDNRARWKA